MKVKRKKSRLRQGFGGQVKFKIILAISVVAMLWFLMPVATFAQNVAPPDLGLEYAANIGLGTADIRDVVANVIRVALGLLGTVAIVIVLYGGFLYMTSEGDAS